MKIGDEYRLRDISSRQWAKLASALGLDESATMSRVTHLASLIPEHVHRICDRIRQDRCLHPIVEVLHSSLAERAVDCMKTLES